MGIINIYGSLSEEHRTVSGNGRLRDILPEYNFDRAVFIKAGTRIGADYHVLPDDVIFVRTVPGSTAVVAGIAIVTAVIAVGVSVGASIYANRQSEEARKKSDKAQRDAQNMAQRTEQLPFIRGAKNSCALGRNIQYVMGSVYNTPYTLSSGWYSTGGENGAESYYNVTMGLGYGSQKVTDIMIGENTVLSDADGLEGYREFRYYDLSGTNAVEICPPGKTPEISGADWKVSSEYSGAELKHEFGEEAEPVIVQAAENAKMIQVCIQFSALRQYDTKSETWEPRRATVRAYWSNDGGGSWNEMTFSGSDNNTFELNTNRTARFVAEHTFTAAESWNKAISIKVVKETPKLESGSQEDCYLLWHQTFQYDAAKSSETQLVSCAPVESEVVDKTTRLAFRFISTDSTAGILDELHCMTTGRAAVWDGTAFSGNEPTRNPASWIYDILTNTRHRPSCYAASEIDLPSLGALYEYCRDNSLFTDGIVTADKKKRDIISQILSSVDTDMIISEEGKIAFAIDREETTPVALLNSENICSVTYAKDFSRRTDGCKVTFTNRSTWQPDSFYAMTDGGGYDSASDTVEAFSCEYVTTYSHAYRMALRRLKRRQLMPREIKVNVGHEGDWYPLYSTVCLQISQLLQGIRSSVITGTRIQDGKLTGMSISDLVTFEDGKRYGVTVQATGPAGHRIVCREVTGSGRTRLLEFTEPVDASGVYPQPGNHLSFGLLDADGKFSRITNVMKIMGTEPNGDDGYTLTLRDYNPEVYSLSASIPEFRSNLTRRQPSAGAVSIDTLPQITMEDVAAVSKATAEKLMDGSTLLASRPAAVYALAASAGMDSVTVAWGFSGSGVSNTVLAFHVELSRNSGGDWTEISSSPAREARYVFDRSRDGFPEAEDLSKWRFRVTAENICNLRGDATVCSVDTGTYGTWRLQKPSVQARVSGRSVTLSLSQPPRSDGRAVYGAVRHRVRVKLTDGGDGFFCPASGLDPYADEDNWRDTEPGAESADCGSLFQQVMPLRGQNAADADGNPLPCPEDTAYTYSIEAYNSTSGTEAEEAAEVNIVALATSARDIVDASITNNKLSEDCVTTGKLHAGCITADKMFSKDLAAMNLTLGQVSGDKIAADSSNFWILDPNAVNSGEFRIGNSAPDDSDDATYLHYKPGEGLFAKFRQFVLKSIGTIVSGVFFVKKNKAADKDAFLTVNPTDNPDTGTGTPAGTVRVTGSVNVGKDVGVSGSVTAGGDMKTSKALYQNGGDRVMGAKHANDYWGMMTPGGSDSEWIRTTSNGILPYQRGGSTDGHQYLGTDSWYFLHAYITYIHAYSVAAPGGFTGNLSGNATSASSCSGNAATATTASRIRVGTPATTVSGDIWLA